jgi:hypothetical protein
MVAVEILGRERNAHRLADGGGIEQQGAEDGTFGLERVRRDRSLRARHQGIELTHGKTSPFDETLRRRAVKISVMQL